MDEPCEAALTTTGRPNSLSISAARSRFISNAWYVWERGVEMPSATKTRFEAALSIVMAAASTPEPV